eukprot:13777278-Alexandrium_andersonii.AAC.1
MARRHGLAPPPRTPRCGRKPLLSLRHPHISSIANPSRSPAPALLSTSLRFSDSCRYIAPPAFGAGFGLAKRRPLS